MSNFIDPIFEANRKYQQEREKFIKKDLDDKFKFNSRGEIICSTLRQTYFSLYHDEERMI